MAQNYPIYGRIDGPIALHGREVAHPAQQTRRHARRTPRPLRDFHGAIFRQR